MNSNLHILPKPARETDSKIGAPAGADRLSPNVARYQQVKDFVSRKIQDGTWKAGDRLPSEHELVVQFGLSRMTVNRALRELVEQGRIKRIAGVGSFVADDKPQANLLQIARLSDDIRRRGHDYQCRVVTVERISASLDIASSLGLHTGESVFHSVCVHLEDGVPMQLEDRYVNPRMAPAFGQQDFTLEQPSDFLVRTVLFDQMEHVVDAVLPTREQAALLQMDPGQPCLLLTRRTWMREDPITLVRCLHPGMRYRLGSRFRTDGNAVTG
ncbi:histidine utilization repressor [Polaromonas sp. P1(28)-8]|nr:histidine utilization repressor [Polaromonas sp. P1(28)-8]